MVLLTRVTTATGRYPDNTVKYYFDPSYGIPLAGQPIQVAGFSTHREFNVTATINSVNTTTNYFVVTTTSVPLGLTESPAYAPVSLLMNVVTVSGTPWALTGTPLPTGTTQERLADPLLYNIIGNEYTPPLVGDARPPTYTSSGGGTPTFDIQPGNGTGSVIFNYPSTQQQLGYSADYQSKFQFTPRQYFSIAIPNLTNVGVTTSPVVRVGVTPGFYLDFWKDSSGLVQGRSSGSYSYPFSYDPNAYGFIDFDPHDNSGAIMGFNGYTITGTGAVEFVRGRTEWGYTTGQPLYLYAQTLPGFVFANNATSIRIDFKNLGDVAPTMNFYSTALVISTDGNTNPNATTLALGAPVLNGSSLVFPGWETINISGIGYSILDLYTHPIVVTLPSLLGQSYTDITFGGDYVHTECGLEGGAITTTFNGQSISSFLYTNIKAYACSPNGTSTLQTQVGYSGVSGSWTTSGAPYYITIPSSWSGGAPTFPVVANSTYIIKSSYFSSSTLITVVEEYPVSSGDTRLTINKVPLQAGSSLGFELRLFTNKTATQSQFIITGTSVSGYSGGNVIVQAYSSTLSLPTLALNVFVDTACPCYSLVAPYLTGIGTPLVVLSAPGGLRTIVSTPLLLSFYGVYDVGPITTITTNLSVPAVTITLTPDVASPTFQLVRYQPFSYKYSIAGYNTDIVLRLNTVSSVLSPYVTSSDADGVSYFATATGSSNTLQNQPVVFDAILDAGVVGTISNSMTIADFLIQAAPSVPGYTIQLYKYESFSNIFSIAPPTSLVLSSTAGSSPEVLTFVTPTTPTSATLFSSSAGYQTSYSAPLVWHIDALAPDGTTASNITLSVPVGAGRFYAPMSNAVYTFYVSENVATTYPADLQFLTYLELDSLPVVSPALPFGISFISNDPTTFQLQGVPTIQTSRQNYLVIGSNTTNGKIVTTKVSIQVKSPRISVSGGPTIISGMIPGVPIAPSTFTSIIPTTSSGTSNFYYNWNSNLPDGLFFQDINGSNVSSGIFSMFPPNSDTAHTITIAGTPTIGAATNLATTGLSNYTTSLTGNTRIPVLNSPVVPIQLSFGELVLFTGTAIPPLYATNPMSSNTLIFKAGTYFPSTSLIESITAENLPDGLSLTTDGVPNFVNGVDYASGVYVSGTPTTVNLSPDPTVVIASNTNDVVGTSSVSIPILPDVITFDSATPTEASELVFVVSRPVFTDYPSGIQFKATSVAGKPITSFTSDPDIGEYGLSISLDGKLTGIPTTVLDKTAVAFIATDSLGTVGVRNVYVTVQPDIYTFTPLVLNFSQNQAITPIQILATTLSGRQVQYYGSLNLPSGFSLSPTGVLTGTQLSAASGTFDVTASTGYDTGTTTYTYSTIPDSILTLLNVSPLVIPVGPFSVDAFRSITYSGFNAPTSYLELSVVPSNITLAMENNVLYGDLTGCSGTYTFTARAVYKQVVSDTTVTLNIVNNTGVFTIGTTTSFRFTTPTTTVFSGFQYVPFQPIRLQATGGSGFVYYYTLAESLPRGLSLVPDPTGVYATIVGTPAIYSANGSPVVVYAKNGSSAASIALTIVVITPFFVNPTSASAYTALLRNTVEENAAHNSEDNKVFPQSDALRGPLLAPPAPDEVVDRKCKTC